MECIEARKVFPFIRGKKFESNIVSIVKRSKHSRTIFITIKEVAYLDVSQLDIYRRIFLVTRILLFSLVSKKLNVLPKLSRMMIAGKYSFLLGSRRRENEQSPSILFESDFIQKFLLLSFPELIMSVENMRITQMTRTQMEGSNGNFFLDCMH